MQFCKIVPIALVWSGTAWGAEVPADPSNYQQLLGTLQPGDTLQLAAGSYPRLTIDGVHGAADAWIAIEGPAVGEPAVITSASCCNTVQLYDSSFVAIRNLVVDVGGLQVDAINAKDSISHDILIENNTLQGFPAGGQQIVGINTKSLAYHWTIRGNTIIEPGTGLYLGNSDGNAPFIAGVIEGNAVLRPVGYCMQIKHQNDYTPPAELPAGPHSTVIRHNVFIKDDRESPDGDRPNLLVGGFPDDGPGSDDLYEVYGNLLFSNPREALFQATGRVSVHDNVFVGAGAGWPALVFTAHQGKSVKLAHAYNNTVYGDGRGIVVSEAPSQSDGIVGNLVFSPDPIAGAAVDVRDNVVDTVTAAADYVTMPAVALGAMDFYPLVGSAAEGAAMDLSKFAGDVDHDRDFNGDTKAGFTFRGAYAGAGTNPGCPLDETVEPECVDPGSDDGGGTGSDDTGDGPGGADGGSDDTGGGGDGAATGGGSVGPGGGGGNEDATGTSAGASDEGDGCGCTSDRGARSTASALLLALAAIRRRRRPSSTRCP